MERYTKQRKQCFCANKLNTKSNDYFDEGGKIGTD